MQLALERWGLTRRDSGSGRIVLSPAAMALLAVAGACLTAVLAQVRLPLPGSPVPMTGQVLGVLLCGALLGGRYGALSQAIYVGAGAAGVPWFTGLQGGWAYAAGVTGGYLLGFIPAALALGWCVRRFDAARSIPGLLAAMLLSVAIIHSCGVSYLMALYGRTLADALTVGSLIFLAADVAKALIAASIVRATLGRR